MVAGQEITVAPEAPRAQIIDLFEALKKSLSEAQKPPSSEAKPPVKAREDEEPAAAAPEKKVAAKRTRARKTS